MVNRGRTSWWRMLFVWKGSILKRILPQLAGFFALAVIVYLVKGRVYEHKIPLNPAIFTLIGLALAIFMGFCNTAAYDRYWEGRKLWGALLIEARNFTRLVHNTAGITTERNTRLVNLTCAFVWALNAHLRRVDVEDKLAPLLSVNDFDLIGPARYKPNLILDLLGAELQQLLTMGAIDTVLFAHMSERLNQFGYILGGCERIATSPLPLAYNLLLHRTVYCYCVLLPFGLVDTLRWMTPLVVLLVAYTFIGLDALLQEIEEPFGTEENDLPLDDLTLKIIYSIREQAGLPVTELAKPVGYLVR